MVDKHSDIAQMRREKKKRDEEKSLLEKGRDIFRRFKKGIITAIVVIDLLFIWIIASAIPEILTPDQAMKFTMTIIIVFLAILIDYLVDIEEAITEPPIRAFADHIEARRDLERFVKPKEPLNADLLEYSSATVHELIHTLVKAGTNIRLLIQHPDKAVSEKQAWRICSEINKKYTEFKGYDNLKIKCYEERASLRGRKFDDKIINVGWYTYDVRGESQNGEEEIHGHDNPTITLSTADRERFFIIKEMFDTTFKNLWDKATPLSGVCKGCGHRGMRCSFRKDDTKVDDWIDRVSGICEEK